MPQRGLPGGPMRGSGSHFVRLDFDALCKVFRRLPGYAGYCSRGGFFFILSYARNKVKAGFDGFPDAMHKGEGARGP